MRKLNLPIIPALKPLISALSTKGIEFHLHGYLCQNRLPFVDIGWSSAEKLQPHLPSGWTLIYAYFVSSEAISQGQPDPLLANADITQVLHNYCPKGMTPEEAQATQASLIEQAQYLMQFPPSRLVYLEGNDIHTTDINNIVANC